MSSGTPNDVTGERRSRNTNVYVTGCAENDKLCNVYDLLDREDEWTLEGQGDGNRRLVGGDDYNNRRTNPWKLDVT